MQVLKYALIGSRGRMGQSFLKVEASQEAICVLEIARDFQVSDWEKKKPELIIDFSLPEAVEKSISLALSKNVALVSGVTGLSDAQLRALEKAGSKIPVFWSPNMSLGIAIMKKMISCFGKNSNYDFHLHESHHSKKIDRPSGTAKYLAEELVGKLNKDCPMSDARGGSVFGYHELTAMGVDDEIQISHRAYNRDIFAKGALSVAKLMRTKTPGFYRMDDIIEELLK